MTVNSAHEVAVTREGQRFEVPTPIPTYGFYFDTPDEELLAWIDVDVELVGGVASIRRVQVTAQDRPLSPRDLQRVPWARIAEGALETAATTQGHRDPKVVRDTRARKRKATAAAADRDRLGQGKRQYRPVTREVMQRVVDLRAQAQAAGVRWDTFAGVKLGYSPTYLRRLAMRADREGITPRGARRGKR